MLRVSPKLIIHHVSTKQLFFIVYLFIFFWNNTWLHKSSLEHRISESATKPGVSVLETVLKRGDEISRPVKCTFGGEKNITESKRNGTSAPDGFSSLLRGLTWRGARRVVSGLFVCLFFNSSTVDLIYLGNSLCLWTLRRRSRRFVPAAFRLSASWV